MASGSGNRRVGTRGLGACLGKVFEDRYSQQDTGPLLQEEAPHGRYTGGCRMTWSRNVQVRTNRMKILVRGLPVKFPEARLLLSKQIVRDNRVKNG